MRSSTGTSGISISRYTRDRPGSGASFADSLAVQAQGDVGVLGGVGGGFLERDLREGNLLGALAGHVLVADGRIAQVARGQRIHVVALARRR
jgi:hypothetical protein